MRHFVTRQRINVNVAAARLHALPDVPGRPLPSPTASSQPLPPRPAMPPPALNPRPRDRRAGCHPEVSPATPRLQRATGAAEEENEAGERSPPGGRRGPLPPPSHRPSPRRARDRRPVPPASPLPPSQAPHAGHYPSTPRSPPNTSSPRRRRRRPESGWGRPGGGFTSILRPDSPLPTRVQYGTERKRRGQPSRDALSARRRPGGGGASYARGVASRAQRGTGRAGWPAESGGGAGRGSARASSTSRAAPPLPLFAPGLRRGRLRGLGQWRAPTSGELLVTARHGRKRPFPFFSRFFLLPPRRPVGLNVRINSIARACTDPRRFPLYFKVPRKTSRPLGFSHFPKHKRPVSVAAAPPVRARPENPFGTDVGESRASGKASRRG